LTSTGGSAQQPVDPDTAAWEAARSTDTYEAYQRYLIQFPVGRYADHAFRLMVEEAIDRELGGVNCLDPQQATDPRCVQIADMY
jgi:hypothetical protein